MRNFQLIKVFSEGSPHMLRVGVDPKQVRVSLQVALVHTM